MKLMVDWVFYKSRRWQPCYTRRLLYHLGRFLKNLVFAIVDELISGDQNRNIHVWDLTANSCSCELVPEVDTSMRSLTVMWDGSLVVAANNKGTCYVWRLLRVTQFLRICMSSIDQYMWIHHLLHTFQSGGDFDEDEDDSDTKEEIEMKNEEEEATGKMETATAVPVSNGVEATA
ncbi:unnamed protein product [Lactuca virosa]|uniref:Target of rapamycin complex subunit LST8 n=1 Tax=Lactuca virosa TaxID=75947 RepID=A0AAU9MH71_9ASTR|nr:unnamed protein product [Lactuca virosa]